MIFLFQALKPWALSSRVLILSTCTALPMTSAAPCGSWSQLALAPDHQGLTLLHFSAQLKRFLWGRGCI
jgi:hypothetical protein